MPDSRFFQPTQSLQVRMWRVRIHFADPMGLESAGTDVYGAERLEEVTVESLRCDCTVRGNPFCIIFRPLLSEIRPGDQFEVELRGLCGIRPGHRIFHDFRVFRAGRAESQFVSHVTSLRHFLENADLWAQPKAFIPREDPAYTGIPSIGLVTHPVLHFHAESVDHVISLTGAGIWTLKAQLWNVRGEQPKEVRRGAVAQKFGDRFIVRVKLPVAPAVFLVTFSILTLESPDKFIKHPLKYTITASDTCPALLTSIDHPVMATFGYAVQPFITQVYGITISPVEYRLPTGEVYFLICFDPACVNYPGKVSQEAKPAATTLFSHRLARQKADPGAKHEGAGPSEGFNSTRKKGNKRGITFLGEDNSKPSKKITTKLDESSCADSVFCSVGTMHQQLGKRLSSLVQDSSDVVHVDVSVLNAANGSQRYAVRLHQHRYYSNLYEGHLFFTDLDVGGRVEMFMRLPCTTEKPEYAPLKIGEWLIIRMDEQLPAGF
jgi:hypothetical protein